MIQEYDQLIKRRRKNISSQINLKNFIKDNYYDM